MGYQMGIVVPVLNQFKLALETVGSINMVNTKPSEIAHRVYVIDNYNENRGVAAAWNLGVDRALEDKCDVIAILNDDIVLGKDTLSTMMIHLLRDPFIGVVTGCDYRNTHSPAEVSNLGNPKHEVDLLDAPDFACFMVTKDSYKHIGRFDENFHPAYFEDNDYTYRTIVSGLKPLRSQNSPFYHYGSQTQNAAGVPVVPSPIFEQNRNYFIEKWGGEPGNESFQHPFNDPNKTWRDF